MWLQVPDLTPSTSNESAHSSLTTLRRWGGQFSYSLLINEETEVQRVQVTCPGHTVSEWQSLLSNPDVWAPEFLYHHGPLCPPELSKEVICSFESCRTVAADPTLLLPQVPITSQGSPVGSRVASAATSQAHGLQVHHQTLTMLGQWDALFSLPLGAGFSGAGRSEQLPSLGQAP